MEAGKKMKEKRILVAVDESEESMHALSWCLTNLFPQNPKTTLVLLYVKPPPTIYSPLDATGYLFAGDDAIETLEKYGKHLVTAVMNRAQNVLTKFNINTKVEKKVGSGDAKDVICAAVKKLGADILVIGSHDYGFLKRALLGSVSEYCSKHVKCPTVVVKQSKNPKTIEATCQGLATN